MGTKVGIFLFYTLCVISLTAAFQLKIHYCRIECTSECPADEEEIPEMPENKTKIPGFYWRDYKGTIPQDAVPLGNPDQKPLTYVGNVFDSSKDGTFTVSIVEGQSYVYNARNGTTRKLSQGIQILCTGEPEKMKWVRLVDQQLSNVVYVPGGTFILGPKQRFAFVARANAGGMYLAGDILGRKDTMEYATPDGSSNITETFDILYYDKNTNDNATDDTKKEEAKEVDQCPSSRGYNFFLNFKIPKFYKELSIGPCSIVCTNIKDKKDKEDENAKKKTGPDSSMYYYWKSNTFFTKEEGFVSGHDPQNNSAYVGQDFVRSFGVDVGYSPNGKSVYLYYANNVLVSQGYTKFLCSDTPDKLKWVSTTSNDFKSMDKSNVLPGGVLYNDSVTYVGRVSDGDFLSPASVRINNDSIWAYYYYYGSYASKNFDVLTTVN